MKNSIKILIDREICKDILLSFTIFILETDNKYTDIYNNSFGCSVYMSNFTVRFIRYFYMCTLCRS